MTATESHPCAQECQYGSCGQGRSGPSACGGCCACCGPCIVDYEDAEAIKAGRPAPGYDPISQYREVEQLPAIPDRAADTLADFILADAELRGAR